MATQPKQQKPRIITPEAILSFPYVWEPRPPQNKDEQPKYSVSLVFPKGTDLTAMKKAALEVGKEAFGADKAADAFKKGKLHWPFRSDPDDVAEKGYPEGSIFVNASSTSRPGVVTIYPGPDGKPTVLEDHEKLYPGCIVKASLTVAPFDKNGNRGVTFFLNNLQLLRDGERLDSRKKAQDEFEADPNATAELEDLEGSGDTDGNAEDNIDDLVG